MKFTRMQSAVGELVIAADDEALRFVLFQAGKMAAPAKPEWEQSNSGIVKETAHQLDAYFAGKLRDFDLPVRPQGTEFQERVWAELRGIPYGTTISYGELAKRVGNPAASRAVGLANGRNPIPIIVPCHRVIGSSGKLTGYGGGIAVKEHLLELEAPQLVLRTSR